MYFHKAQFFDSQVNEPWAAGQYNLDELNRINRMLGLALISDGMKILEPGCGIGRLTEILADRVGARGFVIAMDISALMIDECRDRVRLLTNVQVSCAAVEDHEFSADEFDAIVCHQVFPHFDDKRKVISLFSRILKPLGKLVIFHLINSSQINDVHRKARSAVTNDLIPSKEIITQMLDSCGFRIDIFEDDENGYLLIAHILN